MLTFKIMNAVAVTEHRCCVIDIYVFTSELITLQASVLCAETELKQRDNL